MCFKDQPVSYTIIQKTISLHQKIAVEPVFSLPITLPLPPIIITGRVTNEKGLPLPGVTIMIKGTSKGAITDTQGNFSLQVLETDKTLIVSSIGLKKQEEVEINNRRVINIVMEQVTTQVDQVVVTGIFTRKAATYTGSAVTVTAKELQQFGNRNLISSFAKY